MTKTADKLAKETHSLSDIEKFQIVDLILTDLDKPYNEGRIPTVSYQEVMNKYLRS